MRLAASAGAGSIMGILGLGMAWHAAERPDWTGVLLGLALALFGVDRAARVLAVAMLAGRPPKPRGVDGATATRVGHHSDA